MLLFPFLLHPIPFQANANQETETDGLEGEEGELWNRRRRSLEDPEPMERKVSVAPILIICIVFVSPPQKGHLTFLAQWEFGLGVKLLMGDGSSRYLDGGG